jgi:hypothetical protein
MELESFREQLEGDLTWRQDELRQLRNALLGQYKKRDEWPVACLRTLMVMQYAHLEGFTQHALGLYVEAVNQRSVAMRNLQPQLSAAAVAGEFRALRASDGANDDSLGSLERRARRQVALVNKLLEASSALARIEPDDAVSMEMNLGADVLRKNLYLIGIPSSAFDQPTYGSLDFIKRSRNDVAHGGRKERIEVGVFVAHTEKADNYMSELVRLLTRALRERWYRKAP